VPNAQAGDWECSRQETRIKSITEIWKRKKNY